MQIMEQGLRHLETPATVAHLTYLLKSGCTKVRCGHRRFPMYPGIPERQPYLRASSACADLFKGNLARSFSFWYGMQPRRIHSAWGCSSFWGSGMLVSMGSLATLSNIRHKLAAQVAAKVWQISSWRANHVSLHVPGNPISC